VGPTTPKPTRAKLPTRHDPDRTPAPSIRLPPSTRERSHRATSLHFSPKEIGVIRGDEVRAGVGVAPLAAGPEVTRRPLERLPPRARLRDRRRRAPRSSALVPGPLPTPPPAAAPQAVTGGGLSPDNRSCTRRKIVAYGQLLARLTHTFRTVTRTSAPIFSNFS